MAEASPIAPGDLGGDPNPSAAKPATSSTVKEVEIDGKKFSVDAALAEALTKQHQKTKIQLEENTKQLNELKKGVTPGAKVEPTKPNDPAPSKPNATDLLFTDTEAWMNGFKSQITQELETKYQQAETRKESQKDFWDKFWTVNDDLKQDEKDIVELVMTKNYDELAALPVGEQYKALGDKTRERLLQLGVKKDAGTTKKVVVEGASTPAPEGTPEGEGKPSTESKVTSIADIMKRKAEARRDAIANRA